MNTAKPDPSRKSRMLRGDRRRQLLRCAVETFARRGFAGTKTRDIARAAGVSEAILFRHFATKMELYHAILDAKEDKQGAKLTRELENYAKRRDDAGLFRHLAASVFRSFREDPAFHRLMVYAALEGHLMASLFRERFVMPVGGYLRRYVALRQKGGAFRKCDPDLATRFVLSAIMHYAMNRYVFGMKMKRFPRSEEAITEELINLVMCGLRETSRGKGAE